METLTIMEKATAYSMFFSACIGLCLAVIGILASCSLMLPDVFAQRTQQKRYISGGLISLIVGLVMIGSSIGGFDAQNKVSAAAAAGFYEQAAKVDSSITLPDNSLILTPPLKDLPYTVIFNHGKLYLVAAGIKGASRGDIVANFQGTVIEVKAISIVKPSAMVHPGDKPTPPQLVPVPFPSTPNHADTT